MKKKVGQWWKNRGSQNPGYWKYKVSLVRLSIGWSWVSGVIYRKRKTSGSQVWLSRWDGSQLWLHPQKAENLWQSNLAIVKSRWDGSQLWLLVISQISQRQIARVCSQKWLCLRVWLGSQKWLCFVTFQEKFQIPILGVAGRLWIS